MAGGRLRECVQAAMFKLVKPKGCVVALSACSAFTPPAQSLFGVVLVAVIFGTITLPSVSAWAVLGVQLRRWLSDPVKLRVFNYTIAALLVATLYPVLFAQ